MPIRKFISDKRLAWHSFLWIISVGLCCSCEDDKSLFGGERTFIKMYGGGGYEVVTDLLETADGKFAMIGTSTSFNSDTISLEGNDSDALFILTDRSGNSLVEQAYGDGARQEIARSFVEMGSGGFLVAGTAYNGPVQVILNPLVAFSRQENESQIFLLQLGPNGEQQGAFRYLGATQGDYFEATSLKRTADGGFILLANRLKNLANPGNEGLQIVLMKLNADLDVQWEREFGVDERIADFAGSVLQNPQGEFFIAGALERANNGPLEPRFIRTDPIGNEVFDFRFGDNVANASVNAQSSFIVDVKRDGFGYITTGAQGTVGNRDILLMKLGESPNPDWIKNYGGPGDQIGTRVALTENGDYIVTGASFNGNNANIILMRANAIDTREGLSFEPLWMREFGFEGLDVGRAVLQTRDGGFLVAGSSQFGTISMACLIKTDREGHVSDGL